MSFIFINNSETIGKIMEAGTQNLTGSIVATLLLVLIVLLVICMMFGIPFEFASVILLPFCISVGAFYTNLVGPLIVILLYVSMIIAKNWLFR